MEMLRRRVMMRSGDKYEILDNLRIETKKILHTGITKLGNTLFDTIRVEFKIGVTSSRLLFVCCCYDNNQFMCAQNYYTTLRSRYKNIDITAFESLGNNTYKQTGAWIVDRSIGLGGEILFFSRDGSTFFDGIFYYVKIYINDKLTYNFVPALKDGVYYILETENMNAMEL